MISSFMAAVGEKKVKQQAGSSFDVVTQMEFRELKELVRLLLLRVEALEEAVGESITEEEREDLREALEDLKKGETIKLDEIIKKFL